MFVEIILLFIVLFVLYVSIKRAHRQFEDAGVPTEKPMFILGNLWRSILRKMHIGLDAQRLYTECGDSRTRYIGFYSFLTPVIMIKDPELLKIITVKEFDNFMERQSRTNGNVESMFSRTLLSLKGQRWRDMRATLSPAFTSSKIRDMSPFVSEIGKQMVEYLRECCRKNEHQGNSSIIEVDLKDICWRYMNDVIATAAFGVKLDSFKDRENDFFTMGTKIMTFTPLRVIKILINSNFPRIGQLLRIRVFPQEMCDFFTSIVMDSFKHREENKIIRKDMIHLLMQAKKGSLKHDGKDSEKDTGFATVEESDIGRNDLKTVWSDEDLIAQAVLFFLAGFDTTATLMAFLFVELSINDEVQKNLQKEVDEYAKKNGENPSSDIVQNMKYLDMVISEALRKWTPGFLSDRICVNDFDLGPASDKSKKSYTIKKSDLIWLPIYAIHHDPNYWQDPHKFDPERFSDENKDKIVPYTYIPFGSGPRNCIGSRFALMEAKYMLFNIVYNFNIEVSSKTTVPLQLDEKTMSLKLKNGFWVNLKERRDHI